MQYCDCINVLVNILTNIPFGTAATAIDYHVSYAVKARQSKILLVHNVLFTCAQLLLQTQKSSFQRLLQITIQMKNTSNVKGQRQTVSFSLVFVFNSLYRFIFVGLALGINNDNALHRFQSKS